MIFWEFIIILHFFRKIVYARLHKYFVIKTLQLNHNQQKHHNDKEMWGARWCKAWLDKSSELRLGLYLLLSIPLASPRKPLCKEVSKLHFLHVQVANMFQSHLIHHFQQLPPYKQKSICTSSHNSSHFSTVLQTVLVLLMLYNNHKV